MYGYGNLSEWAKALLLNPKEYVSAKQCHRCGFTNPCECQLWAIETNEEKKVKNQENKKK